MPIYPERPGRPSGGRCGLRERSVLDCEMFHRLALPCGEFFEGQIEYLGTVDLECCFLGITAWIGMIFVSEWRINFTISSPATAA